MEPLKRYSRRRQAYERLAERQQRAANRLSNYRLGTILIGLALSVLLYRSVSPSMGLAVGALTLLLFGYLALRHMQLRQRLRYVKALCEINHQGVERATGRWGAFPVTGAEFSDAEHPFASDLDLFGQASLFQWINATQTQLGRERLADLLQQPPDTLAEIRRRQEAVTDLAQRLPWRQWFQAEGRLVADRLAPTEPLLRWASERQPYYSRPLTKLGIRLLPAATLAVLSLYLFGPLPWQVPALLAGLQAALLLVNGKKRTGVLSLVYSQEAQLRVYALMLERIEQQRFEAEWLRERQEGLQNEAGQSACQQIKRLSKIAERISNRENAIFFVVNLLTLWDFQCLIALEEWKAASGKQLKRWLEVIADF